MKEKLKAAFKAGNRDYTWRMSNENVEIYFEEWYKKEKLEEYFEKLNKENHHEIL